MGCRTYPPIPLAHLPLLFRPVALGSGFAGNWVCGDAAVTLLFRWRRRRPSPSEQAGCLQAACLLRLLHFGKHNGDRSRSIKGKCTSIAKRSSQENVEFDSYHATCCARHRKAVDSVAAADKSTKHVDPNPGDTRVQLLPSDGTTKFAPAQGLQTHPHWSIQPCIAGRLHVARAQAPHLARRDREASTNSIIVETLDLRWLASSFRLYPLQRGQPDRGRRGLPVTVRELML